MQVDVQETEVDVNRFRKFDLNSLVTFLAVYQACGVSRAAKRLNVTQPAVSNVLGKLRMRFDDPLFVPSGRSVRPTPKAELIAQALAPAMRMLQALLLDGIAHDCTEDTP
ncbi:LysR family transcriptional regulator [Pseudomonas putida]|uniref:LysR family transcriptional regulator n=1 Tax=Pseudomonas putida TaxID=303 RepID=UPI00383B1CF4